MKLAVITEPGKVALQDAVKPKPAADEVLVQLMACGVCTLDRRMFSGEQPIYPAAIGHEAAGRIVEMGSELSALTGGLQVGDLVAVDLRARCGACRQCQRGRSSLCQAIGGDDDLGDAPIPILGAMSEFFLCKGKATYPVGEVATTQAAQCEPVACVVHSIRLSGFQAGDHVSIVGAGYMGRLHMSLLRQAGAASIGIIDVSSGRLQEATDAGADWTATPDALSDIPGQSEVVVVTAGVAGAVESALDRLAPGGSVALFGAFPKDLLADINPQNFHHDELSVVGVYAHEPEDWRSAAGLIASGSIASELDDLVTARFPLEGVEDALQLATSQPVFRVFVGED